MGDQVYLRLRAEVLGTRWSVVDRLTEPKLARSLGVSRTPVREALTRLLADGLVRRHDYGYSVVVPDPATARELYEVRAALELRGISRAVDDPCARHDPEPLEAELARWRDARSVPSGPEFVAADERFHLVLLSSAGNAELVSALEPVARRLRSARVRASAGRARVEAAAREHVEIAERVLAGRLPEAWELLRGHIARAQARVDG
ncbi:hypothetical protein BJP25_02650 [Actinokineospora bangkokensis]|uniref:HTH gntR-type domain-containing protein n=1 Tax=Actinokineospora bangkokensis TaxID=1193682 RepID=A0A1Q9LE27_9PSEU|nr:hypothetical protein BJP25_02650 [Actinokineospora bangkokensis]